MDKFQPGISASDGKPCPLGREFSPRNPKAENMTVQERTELASEIKRMGQELSGRVDLRHTAKEMPQWYFDAMGISPQEVYTHPGT